MNDRTAIFTICSNNYIGQAELLFESVRTHHPDAHLFLALADGRAEGDRDPAGVEVLPACELGVPEFASVAFSYDILEFNTALKPFAMLKLFEREYDRVIYFDPDILLFSRLDSVLHALASGASFVLTPHLCSPPGPGAPRTEVDVMRTGVFNLGFIAASRHPETEPALRWWARKLRHECVNDQTGGLFVDQKFIDLLPGFTDHTRILRDTTLNVAYWNIDQRDLAMDGETWTVDGQPLGFFHFSGFDPNELETLSKHATQAGVSPVLRRLFEHYAKRLLTARKRETRPYVYGRFASGRPVPDVVRRMFRDRHLTWSGDPFQTYDAFIRLPFATAAPGLHGEVVNNLMAYMHASSPELSRRFDLGRAQHVTDYVRWFADNAGPQGLDVDLGPRVPRERDAMSEPKA